MIDNKIVIVNGIKYDGNPEDVIRKLVQEIEELKEHRQSYYCVIPWKLLTDKSIPSSAKLLYGEISALSNREGYCWATNEHFAETFGINNPNNISPLIGKLKNANYIYVEIEEGYKRKIWLQKPTLIERGGVMKINKGDYKKSPGGVMKNHNKDNNILDNNNYNNIVIKKYSSLEDIKEEDLIEIAEKYHVSLGFVKLKLETLINYCGAKGRKYKNYKLALRNFVLSDMQKQIERKQDDKYKPIDARNIK